MDDMFDLNFFYCHQCDIINLYLDFSNKGKENEERERERVIDRDIQRYRESLSIGMML